MLQSATLTRKPAARRRAHRLCGLALILLAFALALPAGAFAYISAGGGATVSVRSSAGRQDLSGVAFIDATHA